MNKELQEKLNRIRKSQNRKVMSEYIRIQESDLYDYQPCRATLTTIAFLQVNDEKAHTPPDSPFAGDYVGWCWMSQAKLALRVGKSEPQVQRDIAKFKKDGVIQVRQWRDSNQALHNEYHVIEDVVTAHQRKEGEPRPARSNRNYKDYENKGAFKKGTDPRRDHTAFHAVAGSISRRNHTASYAETIPHFTRDTIPHVTRGDCVTCERRGILRGMQIFQTVLI